ncbi:MAG: hypothetical protein H8E76_00905 [Helicobacteraceae bacterium]|nr:hypothetical protein [Candidatus Sulfurimonas ponti]
MIYIFLTIFLISILLLFIGLVSPSFIIRWQERAHWGHVLGVFSPLIFISYLAIVFYPASETDIEAINLPIKIQEEKKDYKTELTMIEEVETPIQPEPPTWPKDIEMEESSFNKRYQSVINILRKILSTQEITLYKGVRTDHLTHKILKFKTDTVYEMTMKIDNQKNLQSIYTIIEKGTEVKDLKNIISSVICAIDSQKITLQECKLKSEELFHDIRTNKVNKLEILGATHVLSIGKEKYYRVTPN